MNSKFGTYLRPLIGAAILAGAAFAAAAQSPAPPAKPQPKDKPEPSPTTVIAPRPLRYGYTDSELRVATNANVSVKFCIADANLKINGWDRNEVRVFVRSGRKFNIRVLERDQNNLASWVWITPETSPGAATGLAPTCLSGASIEVDAPVGSSFNLDGRSSDAVIDTVKKVGIKIVEGNVSLRNITGGISASTWQGDLTAESSAGSISLESTTGNVVAYGVSPGQVGDLFRVKTNSGAVSIQNVEHRQIEASTISGSLVYDGVFRAGGIYNFKTSNGSIRVMLPENASCKLFASYGFGSFGSDFPLKFTFKTDSEGPKSLSATIGAGENCSLNLTTTTGSIVLKKK